jgi:hypothetical protein
MKFIFKQYKIIFTTSIICVLQSIVLSQSYAPPAGQVGTTAIHKDSSVFVSWATGVEFRRGFLQISDTTITIDGDNKASHGEAIDALGKAEGNSMNVLSLGDGGYAILTFQSPIINGEGADFAVFENSFQDDFLELAFVEVSSDGIHFFRFPSHSENQFEEQLFSFGLMDCRFVHNLAGKYRQGFGTPFDLDDLPDSELLDKMSITHVKIIDVIGIIEPEFASLDSFGNIINDPYPTPFPSGGFDLDAVGVIHQKPLNTTEDEILFVVSPNPFQDQINIQLNQEATIRIYDLQGKLIVEKRHVVQETIDASELYSGIYILQFETENSNVIISRIIKM